MTGEIEQMYRMVAGLHRIKVEPDRFLETLRMYIEEEDDELLGHVWVEPNYQGPLLNGIYMLTTLRTEEPEVWAKCEPVVRVFWNRFVGKVFFRGDDRLTKIAREITYRNWFGEDEKTK